MSCNYIARSFSKAAKHKYKLLEVTKLTDLRSSRSAKKHYGLWKAFSTSGKELVYDWAVPTRVPRTQLAWMREIVQA